MLKIHDPNETTTLRPLTPCKAACKNDGGLCMGCLRTMNEIIGWQSLSTQQRIDVMQAISGERSTHLCPSCLGQAQCDIKEGKETCWCFDIERRDVAQLSPQAKQADRCVCRSCLQKLPLL